MSLELLTHDVMRLETLSRAPTEDRTLTADFESALHAAHLSDTVWQQISAPAIVAEVPGGMPAVVASLTALQPQIVERFSTLGIPDPVTVDTLGDIGNKLQVYGPAMDLRWLCVLGRADVLAFGRLHAERVSLHKCRGLHIPEGGPLTPSSVETSLQRIDGFFDDGIALCCTSWILDPRLQELPENSNIATFARRFELDDVVPSEHASESVAKFVFQKPLEDVRGGAVRPISRLQALVARTLRSEQDWCEPHGAIVQSTEQPLRDPGEACDP